jgi:hypothetical protein
MKSVKHFRQSFSGHVGTPAFTSFVGMHVCNVYKRYEYILQKATLHIYFSI